MGHSGDDFKLAVESSKQVDLRYMKNFLRVEIVRIGGEEPSDEFVDKYRYEGETGEKLGE